MQRLSDDTRELIRHSYVIRRIPGADFVHLLPIPDSPQIGDVLLTKVVKIGKNARVELANGRMANLHEGDLIAAVLGNRYATQQFEGYARVGADRCDMLSMGGLCGIMESRHASAADPTRLEILGTLGNGDGRQLRLSDYSLPQSPFSLAPRVVVVCGSSMDTGKTHTACDVIIGLRKLGVQVAGIKLTGTAAGRDTWAMLDAGARPALDFLDGGLPSTYLCSLERLMILDRLLLSYAAAEGATWAVIELADGIVQRETSSLLQFRPFTASVDAWMYATGDALGAAGGVNMLKEWGIEPAAVSGLVSMSPLAVREVREATSVRCVTASELQSGALNQHFVSRALIPFEDRAPTLSTLTAGQHL